MCIRDSLKPVHAQAHLPRTPQTEPPRRRVPFYSAQCVRAEQRVRNSVCRTACADQRVQNSVCGTACAAQRGVHLHLDGDGVPDLPHLLRHAPRRHLHRPTRAPTADVSRCEHLNPKP
eukprot:3901323-Rhodomonas_salina.1